MRIRNDAGLINRLLGGDDLDAATLPEPIRRHAESLFRTDLSGVRVHVSELVRDLGCRALTCGHDIYLAPGEWVPGATSGLALIGHELAHVVQQRQGRLRGRGPARVVVSPRLEEEANLAGAVFAATWEAGRGGLPPLTFDEGAGGRRSRRGGVLQPVLLVNGVRQTDVDKLYQELSAAIKGAKTAVTGRALDRMLIEYKDEMRQVLKEWISTSGSRAWRVVARQKAVSAWRDFPDNVALARALIGEVMSRPSIEIEKMLAREAEGSAYINSHLSSVVRKLGALVVNEPANEHKTRLLTRNGRYAWYYPLRDVAKVFRQPETYSFAVRAAILHDLSDYFYYHGGRIEVPADKEMGSVVTGQKPDGTFDTAKVSFDHPNHFRDDNDLMREDHPLILAARERDMPLCLGPSYTTGRVMQMISRPPGGTNGVLDQLVAGAWTMFAFWNRHYIHAASGIHTFHEVMDMASNYGVPYTPFVYPDRAPQW